MITKRLDKSLSTLIKDCDDAFRKYIQKRDEGKPCFICGNRIPKGDEEVCHFIPRLHLGTRWDEFNGHLGCMTCNRFDLNHYFKYATRISVAYGDGKLRELELLRHSLMKPLRSDLVEIIDTYKQKLKELR